MSSFQQALGSQLQMMQVLQNQEAAELERQLMEQRLQQAQQMAPLEEALTQARLESTELQTQLRQQQMESQEQSQDFSEALMHGRGQALEQGVDLLSQDPEQRSKALDPVVDNLKDVLGVEDQVWEQTRPMLKGMLHDQLVQAQTETEQARLETESARQALMMGKAQQSLQTFSMVGDMARQDPARVQVLQDVLRETGAGPEDPLFQATQYGLALSQTELQPTPQERMELQQQEVELQRQQTQLQQDQVRLRQDIEELDQARGQLPPETEERVGFFKDRLKRVRDRITEVGTTISQIRRGDPNMHPVTLSDLQQEVSGLRRRERELEQSVLNEIRQARENLQLVRPTANIREPGDVPEDPSRIEVGTPVRLSDNEVAIWSGQSWVPGEIDDRRGVVKPFGAQVPNNQQQGGSGDGEGGQETRSTAGVPQNWLETLERLENQFRQDDEEEEESGQQSRRQRGQRGGGIDTNTARRTDYSGRIPSSMLGNQP